MQNTIETDTTKHWAIFYEAPNGEIFSCATHLGCVYLAKEEINIYCDEKKLQELYQQTIAYTKRKSQAPEGSGHAYWEGWLKPKYRNGRVFISRVDSKDFPAELLKAPRFQKDNETHFIWALRVPCKIKNNIDKKTNSQ